PDSKAVGADRVFAGHVDQPNGDGRRAGDRADADAGPAAVTGAHGGAEPGEVAVVALKRRRDPDRVECRLRVRGGGEDPVGRDREPELAVLFEQRPVEPVRGLGAGETAVGRVGQIAYCTGFVGYAVDSDGCAGGGERSWARAGQADEQAL